MNDSRSIAAGIAAGLAAGALWGLVFVLPRIVYAYSGMEVTLGRYAGRIQPVDATVWLNISAGVWKPRVFLGLSFNCLATALSLACE